MHTRRRAAENVAAAPVLKFKPDSRPRSADFDPQGPESAATFGADSDWAWARGSLGASITKLLAVRPPAYYLTGGLKFDLLIPYGCPHKLDRYLAIHIPNVRSTSGVNGSR